MCSVLALSQSNRIASSILTIYIDCMYDCSQDFQELRPNSRQNTASVYQLTLQSAGLSEIHTWAPQLAARMRQIPGFVDVNTGMQINAPQVMVDIDRDRAQALGVTPEQIQDALYSAYGTREVSVIYAPADQYSVIMEAEPQYQPEPLDPADCGDPGDLYRTGRTVRELHSPHHDSLRPAPGGVRHAADRARLRRRRRRAPAHRPGDSGACFSLPIARLRASSSQLLWERSWPPSVRHPI